MEVMKVRQEVPKSTVDYGVDYIRDKINEAFPEVEDIMLTDKGEVEWSQGSGVSTTEITKLISKL